MNIPNNRLPSDIPPTVTPSKSPDRREKRLFFLTLLFAWILPLFNTVILGSVNTMLSGDIMIPEIVPEILDTVSELWNIACMFCTAACFAYAVVTGCRKKAVLTVGFVSPVLLYAASVAVDYAFWGSQVFIGEVWFSVIAGCLYELIRYVILLVVCLILRRESTDTELPELFSKRNLLSKTAVWTTVIYGISILISRIADTVTLLLYYGKPINTTELVYLILPYPTAIVYTLLGYLMIFLQIKKLHCMCRSV